MNDNKNKNALVPLRRGQRVVARRVSPDGLSDMQKGENFYLIKSRYGVRMGVSKEPMQILLENDYLMVSGDGTSVHSCRK